MPTSQFDHIGILHTPFKEKFGIPRQPGLANVEGLLEFLPPYNDPIALAGLEQVTHVWVSWLFHACPDTPAENWQKTVRPPRLGGNQRLGIFATRSGFRPNRLGMSVCALRGIKDDGSLTLAGVDMLDGTPVIDIKPYVPYVDAIGNAQMPWASAAPSPLEVTWTEQSQPHAIDESNRRLIESVLSQDPRPAYHQDDRSYGMRLADFNIRFRIKENTVEIFELTQL